MRVLEKIKIDMIALTVALSIAMPLGPPLRGSRQQLLFGSQPPKPLRVNAGITSLAAQTNGGSTATPQQKEEMECLAQMLERQNPCAAPTASPSLLDGEWDQIYTDNPIGITFGNGRMMRRKLRGPFTGRVTQLIDTSAASAQYRQRIQTRAGLLRGELRVDVSATSPSTWTVRFDHFALKVLRVPVIRRSAAYEGTWTHTYVDATTRIMRTQRAGAEGAGFMFILRRRR